MSLATLYVVYGISLIDDEFKCYKNDIEILDEEEIATSYYHSPYEERPVCLGVRLCSVFESETVQLSNLELSPSEKIKQDFRRLFDIALNHNKISVDFKQILMKHKPDTFVMWGSD